MPSQKIIKKKKLNTVLIQEQGNHVLMAQLRLVQAEMVLAQIVNLGRSAQREQPASIEMATDRYLDAILAAAQTSQNALLPTVERIEIIRQLRQGKFDVLVGINLLREGLDLPEVGLVAVLDADKEGFLRTDWALMM